MVDVVLSGDSVTVLGGPSKLDVDLNIGAEGSRGSLIFVNSGNPNDLNPQDGFPLAPQLFDIFIDVSPSSENFLQAYQYRTEDGSESWRPAFKITQNVYRLNKPVEFTQGEAIIDVNLSELGLNGLPFEGNFSNAFAYFNVQATISNINLDDPQEESRPAAISVEVGDPFFGTEDSFDSGEYPAFVPISFNASELVANNWVPIDDKRVIVYLSISFADPSEIFAIAGNPIEESESS
jgi:hypothetical protein